MVPTPVSVKTARPEFRLQELKFEDPFATKAGSVPSASELIPAKARWLVDQLHSLRAQGLTPKLAAAERMACFLRIADRELRKGGLDGQDVEDSEVHRVAIELSKLHAAGHFPNVAEASMLVDLFHLFKATLLENPPVEPPGNSRPSR